MNGLRLALVTRRFWPLTGEAELAAANLAADLLQRGHQPVVVTPKYGRQWPSEICVREAPVVRLPHPSPRPWGHVRYLFSLSRWLQQRRHELDAVIVLGPDEDAISTLGAVRDSHAAVIFVADAMGQSSPTNGGAFGERLKRRVRDCDAIVVSDETSSGNRWLRDLAADKLRIIPLGVRLPPPRSPVSRAAARQSLADVNHDLAAASDAPIALCLSPFIPESNLAELVRAWRGVQGHWPEARLWLIGDGPERDSLFGLISDLGLKYRVSLPGTFDDWCDLLQAADVLIQPTCDAGHRLAVLEAMAAGTPVIQCSTSEATSLTNDAVSGYSFDPQSTSIVVPRHDIRLLAPAINHLFEQPSRAVSLGIQARQWIAANRSHEAMVDGYEQLLADVVSQRAARR